MYYIWIKTYAIISNFLAWEKKSIKMAIDMINSLTLMQAAAFFCFDFSFISSNDEKISIFIKNGHLQYWRIELTLSMHQKLLYQI